MNFKKILFAAAIAAVPFTAFSQTYNYNDLGVLFSQDDNRGTARFNAMSGAFGALGGDISSVTINPAGAAVAKLSSISITGANSKLEYDANYYGETNSFQDTNFRIPQIGGIFVFSNGRKSDWNRTALYFNYRTKANFAHSYEINGNSQFLFYNTHLNDPTEREFGTSVDQYISNNVSGRSDVFDFGFSTVHKNKLFLGAALKFHSIEFGQESVLNELNEDNDGNLLESEEYTNTFISGNGFSANFGFIYKFNSVFRLGLSYETPTFYSEIIEDYYDELIMFENTDLSISEYFESSGDLGFLYRLQTPSRITASGALVFGKQGLISLDYTFKDYKNIEFSDGDFLDVNSEFLNSYHNIHEINVGTEWRFDNLSLRGGISYQSNARFELEDFNDTNDLMGYSLGLGYNFGKTKFDLSFNNSENVNYYQIYNAGDLSIDRRLTQISGTLTFDL